jgi:hypothetical protein
MIKEETKTGTVSPKLEEEAVSSIKYIPNQ